MQGYVIKWELQVRTAEEVLLEVTLSSGWTPERVSDTRTVQVYTVHSAGASSLTCAMLHNLFSTEQHAAQRALSRRACDVTGRSATSGGRMLAQERRCSASTRLR